MRLPGLTLAAGALMVLPLLSPSSALADDSAAYPKSPSGTPAASDGGKPVETKGSADSKPDPADKAGTESAPSKTGTPATAYPGAPTSQPTAGKSDKP